MADIKILMPLPDQDFDPTEVCITWRILCEAGFQVEFATSNGERAHADPLMISGEGLDPWGWIPGLKKIRLIGLMLRAQSGARQAYAQLEQTPAFLKPIKYEEIDPSRYDCLVLPGGHARGMRPYLESQVLQNVVVEFFETFDDEGQHKPVAAVCHGVLLAARSISKRTGRSVLAGRKTTALTWSLEKSAWDVTRWLARYWDPLYYRTYSEDAGEPQGYWSVESEIKRLLEKPSDFKDVPAGAPNHFRKASGLFRDTAQDPRAAWVVQDGHYLSARWPGDVHTFAKSLVTLLRSLQNTNSIS